MKVAIITWIYDTNFGTVLQAYSLQKYLTNQGFEVENIDTHRKQQYFATPISKIISYKNNFIPRVLEKVKYKNSISFVLSERQELFNRFISTNIRRTKSCETSSELFTLNSYYDKFISGSDQIWNPGSFDKKYLLDFVEDNTKKISYASSFGVNEIPTYFKKIYRENLNSFSHIGVREKTGEKIVKELTEKDKVEIVVDPTLLLSKNDYDQFTHNIEIDNYILCYFLGYNIGYIKNVIRLASTLNKKIVVIPIHSADLYTKNIIIEKDIGIEKFLSLIKYSDLICTDSYHGIIFSSIFEKKCIPFKRFSDTDKTSQNSRVYNLLKTCGVEDKLVSNSSKFNEYLSNIVIIKYPSENILSSMEYIKCALSKEDASKVKFKTTNTCCGCGACVGVCPTNAIKVLPNKNGFRCSKINTELCIECGICRKVCPNFTEIGESVYESPLYAFRINDKNIYKSASGGFGRSIINYALEKNYKVISCVYDSTLHEAKYVELDKTKKGKTVSDFVSSKYLQPDTKIIFTNIDNNPKEKYLIIGLPCHISAIRLYTQRKHIADNFLFVDLICHGVPSQNLWTKYLNQLQYSDKHINFRYKKNGKSGLNMFFNKDKIIDGEKDLFYSFFKLSNCYSDSCYECRFRKNSAADVRIGDYWHPKYVKDNGTSMVLLNNEKGHKIYHELLSRFDVYSKEESIADYIKYQQQENMSKPIFYNKLMEELGEDENNLEELERKYCRPYNKLKNVKKIYGYVRSKIM